MGAEHHIHIVWYVINAARGRLEDFECVLVRDLFAHIPVIFILNKADLADADQLLAMKETIKKEGFTNVELVQAVVSKRDNPNICNWCPECQKDDDLMFEAKTGLVTCAICDKVTKQENIYGLEMIVHGTCELLPDMVRDSFIAAQILSLAEKDKRAKEIVLSLLKKFSLDLSGDFIIDIASLFSSLFVVWNFNFHGMEDIFGDIATTSKTQFVNMIDWKMRFAVSMLDKMAFKMLSKSGMAITGIMTNQMLREMYKLITHLVTKSSNPNLSIGDTEDSRELEKLKLLLMPPDHLLPSASPLALPPSSSSSLSSSSTQQLSNSTDDPPLYTSADLHNQNHHLVATDHHMMHQLVGVESSIQSFVVSMHEAGVEKALDKHWDDPSFNIVTLALENSSSSLPQTLPSFDSSNLTRVNLEDDT
eukprot:TRINITY_DN4735_c0_g1_i1.p2 TRINITY_DN4735_c0_g1~~TRINITY_DN4735_c0_g1_i1.p2  ORF type:complete len:420 (+),score=87.23 TRINITY_DN4735_c0_g1_i1:369-1628(+)